MKNKRITALILLLLSFFSSSLVISSGFLSKTKNVDIFSEYIADISKNHTKNGKYSWIAVSDRENNKKMPNLVGTVDEYNYWKYAYRHSNFAYAKIANANKKINCYYSDLEKPNDSLVFLTAGSNESVLLNSNGKEHYRHDFYDIYLMFKNNKKINSNDSNFCSISKKRATELLKKTTGVVDRDFSDEEYFSLIGTSINFSINNDKYSWTIDDIYIDEFEQNDKRGEFFANLTKTVGEFVLAFNLLPNDLLNSDVYFFDSHSFQNKSKIERIISAYTIEKVDVEFCSCCLKENFSFQQQFLDNIYKDSSSSLIYLVIVLYVLFMFSEFLLLWHFKFDFSGNYFFLLLIFPLLLFVCIYIFKYIFHIYYFSINLLLLFDVINLCLAAFLLVFFRMKNGKKIN